LRQKEKIGNLIIDVGSGASPVTQLLKAEPARKRICIDIAADNVGSLNDLRIRLDAEKVGQFGSLSFRKALLRVCAFLGINPKTEATTERADTIVFSDMLNYVDFRKGSEWVWELSETRREDYCLQFAQSGKRIVIF
jgi:hypothetical protein